MIFTALPPAGAFLIDLEPLGDHRGLFARTFCVREFAAHGLVTDYVQCNTSYNARLGTLRGMHYQEIPHPEVKIVRCTRGRILDVILDLRPASATFKTTAAIELSAENRKMLYVPAGFAHGFQTLENDTEVFYQMSDFYVPELARGVRWNDPAFGITWPIFPPIVSDRDAGYTDFDA